MELKPGFKQTEVGVIPEDWDAVPIGRFCICFSGGTPSTSNPRYYSGNIPWITSSDLNKRRITEVAGRITEEGLANSAAKLVDEGTLLIALYGATAGVCAISEIDSAINQAVLAVITRNAATEFLFQFLTLRKAHYIKTYTQGGQPNFSGAIVKAFVIALPPLPEQRAIATALSDVDALLEGLDRLIAKKRDLKQATMQQLLTGKTRLPGFEGEWEVRALSDVCWFQEGPGVRNYQFTNSGVKLFNGTNIEDGRIDLDKTNRFISEKEAYGWYSHFLADAGDIVIACSGVTIEKFEQKVSVIEEAHLPICMNTSTMRFKVLSAKLHNQFLLQFLRSSQFKQQIGGSATGSAQLNFGPSHVQKVFIDLPILEEQTAIATVLSDMDAEIAAVEQRRNKTKNIKQAMMQELLTGKTRLVTPGGSNA